MLRTPIAVLVLTVGAIASNRSVGADYIVTDLGDLESTYGVPRALNNLGHVLLSGAYTPGQSFHHYIYRDGAIQDLGDFGSSSFAFKINDSDQVAGIYVPEEPNWYYEGFLWDDGTIHGVGAFGRYSTPNPRDPQGLFTSYATGLNNQGQVVGSATNESGGSEAFLFQNGNLQHLFATPAPYVNVSANAINDLGEIVGSLFNGGQAPIAYVYANGLAQLLSPPVGYVTNTAFDINNDGQVLMSASTKNGGGITSYFLYNGAERIVLAMDNATDINNLGQVVGSKSGGVGISDRALLYDGGVSRDLNELIAPDSGWLLYSAIAINDRGQILGEGVFDGESRVYLLTPVPEPTTISLIAIGALSLLVSSLRYRQVN